MAKLNSFVIVLGVIAVLQCAEAQTVHVVGDSLGWAVPQAGASAYQTWADNNKFVVGDILCNISLSLSYIILLYHDSCMYYV